MRKLVQIVPLLLLLQPALGASFDCAKARSQMEKLICSDEKLSKADEELNVAFKQAAEVSGAKSVIAQWQREWLRSYEVAGCKDARCLTVAVTTRTELLQSVAPAGDSSSKWNGRYVRFRNGKEDPDSAALLLVGLLSGRAHISGTSVWRGLQAGSGQVNTGEIEGVGTAAAGKLVFDSGGCSGQVLRSKEGVVVAEESGCGGLNVTFNGEYRKK